MAIVSPNFRKFVPQLLHTLVIPIFFFAFMLIYRPHGAYEFLGHEWFAVHLTILSCIIFLSEVIARLAYYFLALKINYTLYSFWCLAEILFMAFFVALYLWLALHDEMHYFEVVSTSFKYLFLVLLFPYTTLALSLRLNEYHKAEHNPDDQSVNRIRFYDDKHNLKIVLTSESILYIAAEQNYVTILYSDGGKEREYTLRNSMKAIDEVCQDNGLIRCHRSYYINPSFVKVLRKDKEGIIYAEMESTNGVRIPVSKKYYEHLADLLY